MLRMKGGEMKWNDVEGRSVGVDVIEKMAIGIVVVGEIDEVVQGVEVGQGLREAGEMKPKNVVDR